MTGSGHESTSDDADFALQYWLSAFSGMGLVCFLAVSWLAQELTRVAIDLRNPDGTYTLGVGWLRLSGFARLGVPLYWLAHLWLLAAAWRAVRRRRRATEWAVAAFLALAVAYVHFLLSSTPLNHMMIRPWIR